MNSQNKSMVQMGRNPWNLLVLGIKIISGKYKERKKPNPQTQPLTCYNNLQSACLLVFLPSMNASSDQKSGLLKFISKLHNEVAANVP